MSRLEFGLAASNWIETVSTDLSNVRFGDVAVGPAAEMMLGLHVYARTRPNRRSLCR